MPRQRRLDLPGVPQHVIHRAERVNKNPTPGVGFLCNNFRQIGIYRSGYGAQ